MSIRSERITIVGRQRCPRRDEGLGYRETAPDVDPFGDFELLFPASILGLGIVDVPVYYRARLYGATNIHRFRHGLMLLRMTLIGLFRVKGGAPPAP